MAVEEVRSQSSIVGRPEFVALVPPLAPLACDLTSALDHQTEEGKSLYARLRTLDSERLAEILLHTIDKHGESLRLLVEEALRKVPPSRGPARSEDAEPFMVGSSPAMQGVYTAIRKFAATDAPVLVTGESGTGKELVARAIHERSAYGRGAFVPINCAALPPTLIAAELFGHEKGAFTGAAQRRIGRLEFADRGTIFLDEIGDLPLEQQAHLLRFLQERTIERVGGTRPIKVDARVICATNGNLFQAIGEGKFREDLYYRLHVLSIHLPSLRERGSDLELLATFFLRKFARDHGRDVAGFSEDAWAQMRAHSWPGNVRELIAAVRRALVMTDGPWVSARDLGLDEPRVARAPAPPGTATARSGVDEQRLRAALAENTGNVTTTARHLGLSRMTIYRAMRRYGIA